MKRKCFAKAVLRLQSITELPLQIDTSNVEAAEAAARIYNGKPLINSVNGKKESLASLLPVAKKYGAALIALTLDENGIPEGAAERIAIAERIVSEAEKYGIGRENIIIDPLAMTIATGSGNAITALEVLDYCKNKLKVKTSMGVSNISFGLPSRDFINTAFLTMAISRGLNAAIMNPLSLSMKAALLAADALAGRDDGCARYIAGGLQTSAIIEKKPEQIASQPEKQKIVGLADAIYGGQSEKAAALTAELLGETKPLAVINSEVIPALNAAGKSFAENKIFLPQLLMCADAAGAAFEKIKAAIEKSGAVIEKKGKSYLRP